jgi:hypothetical protein
MRWRTFLALWAAAMLAFAVAGFVDSQWASRYDPLGRCGEAAHVGYDLGRGSTVVASRTVSRRVETERWPPRVRCLTQECQVRHGAVTTCHRFTVVANAKALDWLILLAYSAGYGLLVAAVLAAVLWFLGRFGVVLPKRPRAS